ncbi:DUF4177 domain-containing protein [Actinoalloteichus hymeniacidonis]|uniref:DUF4177 family protein n=1 Tax=Actinoalloteichus hymeniacidonis TaxID=340345 RepID=A0AAC9HS49_9PSEU|nr:DUF4177 domain-containing protein [Actinoalloteichus hymeniacidonis]AOS63951.1 putative DUF4177 family protein [Actinoalloteichus hymeniacidonis]MBB5907992.1 hypothetical protein [Actinoalloteichus hymeniacidonis]
MATNWEHRVLTYPSKWKGFDLHQIEEDLNELGRQGWETVSTIAPNIGPGQTVEISIIVKRPRP